MIRMMHNSAGVSTNFAVSLSELVRSTLGNLILVIGGSSFLLCIAIAATWPERFGWNVQGLAVLLMTICLLSYWLLGKKLVWAQMAWHGGMLIAVTLAVWMFRRPEIVLFYALLPFMAVISISWVAGLLVECMIVGLVIWLSQALMGDTLSGIYATMAVTGGICTWMIGWVMSHTLLTALEWYAFSFARAEENLESVRQHRGQLMRVQKSLDEAYYHLQRTNSALVTAWKIADEAERFKAEFVTNVSHELRTPLNLIVGFSEVMIMSPESYGGVQLPGPYRSDLNAVYHSAQHLLALVDDVIGLARIEAGKIALSRDEADLAMLILETLDIVRDYIAAKGLDLQVAMAPDLPRIWIDRLRVRQVLLNLLVNAARFTDKGYVRVEATCEDGEVVVRVTDTGQGIPLPDMPKIFEEFRSMEQPLSTWHSGAGLGLPISKKFIELHHGRMGVESVHLQGTTFWFTLPVKPIATTQASRAPVAHANFSTRLMPSEKIVVVVHDDKSIAPLLQRYLDGYRVLGTSDLSEGIELAEAVKALALIGDSSKPLPALPESLLMLRCPLPSSYHAAVALGATNLLVKPITGQQLQAAIRELRRPLRRILIADDDPDVARLFSRMLSTYVAPEACHEAYNGEEALRLMRAEKPDLVLLDLVMPELDGRSVLKQMAEDPMLAEIPVIVISAMGQDYVNVPLCGPIEIARANGFQIGECVQAIEAVLKALAPAWHPQDAIGTRFEVIHAGSMASSDNGKRPTA